MPLSCDNDSLRLCQDNVAWSQERQKDKREVCSTRWHCGRVSIVEAENIMLRGQVLIQHKDYAQEFVENDSIQLSSYDVMYEKNSLCCGNMVLIWGPRQISVTINYRQIYKAFLQLGICYEKTVESCGKLGL